MPKRPPQYCGSRGQLSTTSHFFRGSYVPLIMARSLIIFFLPRCHFARQIMMNKLKHRFSIFTHRNIKKKLIQNSYVAT
uniref:Uncharacterized protein n=1 Tax=Vespula pensylvanica TaxID=30213 RepID=A0A834KHW3_VESPE|nr:hypothetical protein H0235_015035 [Vespula pensylvanica]